MNKNFNKIILQSSFAAYFFYLINFFGNIVLARFLTPEIFGEIALALAITGVIDIFFGLSLPMAYINHKNSKSLSASIFFISKILSILILSLAIILFVPLKFLFDIKLSFFVFAILISKIFNVYSSIKIAHFEKKGQISLGYLIRGVSQVAGLIAALLLILLDQHYLSLIVKEVFSKLILFVLSSQKKLNFKNIYNKDEIKKIFSFCVNQLFSRSSELIFFKLSILIIGYTKSEYFLGIFVQAFYLASLIPTALNPITDKIAFIFYSVAKVKNNFIRINLISLIVILPTSILIYFFSYDFIYFIYGEKWLDSAKYLKNLSIFVFLMPFFANLNSYFYSLKKAQYVTIAYLIGSAVLGISIIIDKIDTMFSYALFCSTLYLYIVKNYKK